MQLAHQAVFSLGPLEVRPPTCEVVSPHGREVLQPRVMQVLVALTQARGGVVSRHDLIAQCWDGRLVVKQVGEGNESWGRLAWSQIAELHEGRITVESTPGDGSTFTLFLPVHSPPAPNE